MTRGGAISSGIPLASGGREKGSGCSRVPHVKSMEAGGGCLVTFYVDFTSVVGQLLVRWPIDKKMTSGSRWRCVGARNCRIRQFKLPLRILIPRMLLGGVRRIWQVICVGGIRSRLLIEMKGYNTIIIAVRQV